MEGHVTAYAPGIERQEDPTGRLREGQDLFRSLFVGVKRDDNEVESLLADDILDGHQVAVERVAFGPRGPREEEIEMLVITIGEQVGAMHRAELRGIAPSI